MVATQEEGRRPADWNVTHRNVTPEIANRVAEGGTTVYVPGAKETQLTTKERQAQRHTFVHRNKRMIEKMRQDLKEKYRIDADRQLAESDDEDFSWRAARKSFVREARRFNISEAVSSTAFSQLLRYGITRLAAEGYELEPSVYENEIAEVVTSTGFENYYAPMYRPGRGGPVARGQAYPAVKMSGLDVTIRNFKFGSLLEIEQELAEDDQTGQIMQQAPMLGESLSQEVDMYGFAQMAALAYNSWVNRIATATGALTTPQVSEAHAILRKVHDTNSNLMVVKPDTLLVDSDEELVGRQILDSMVAAQNPGATPTAGSVIYFGTMNPLRGLYKLVATPWVTEALRTIANPNGWGNDATTPAKWLLRARRRIIQQNRRPLAIVQEAPNSGANFEADLLRTKGSMRFGAGVVDSRYACRLN